VCDHNQSSTQAHFLLFFNPNTSKSSVQLSQLLPTSLLQLHSNNSTAIMAGTDSVPIIKVLFTMHAGMDAMDFVGPLEVLTHAKHSIHDDSKYRFNLNGLRSRDFNFHISRIHFRAFVLLKLTPLQQPKPSPQPSSLLPNTPSPLKEPPSALISNMTKPINASPSLTSSSSLAAPLTPSSKINPSP